MKGIVPMPRGRIFIVESPNAADLLEGRQEAATLINACRVIGYDVANFIVRSFCEFATTCRYIAKINTQSEDDHETPLFVHISSHGNKHGLTFGPDRVSWQKMTDVLSGFCPMPRYKGPIIVVLSACGAGQQSITEKLAAKHKRDLEFVPLKYVFVTDETLVDWADALVAWTMFYHQIDRIGLDHIAKVKEALGRVAASAHVKMKYFRWDDNMKKYRKHSATS
jgi:hypothetical protein